MSRGQDGIETNFQVALYRKSKKHEKSTAVKEEKPEKEK